MPQSHSYNADRYRRRAQTCALLAECARSSAESASLTRMRDHYLGLAANEDWLDGLPPLPPVNVCALVAH